MPSDAVTLTRLNEVTFRAENREGDWEPTLRALLSDHFVLRRANKARPDEGGEALIEAIRHDARQRRLIEDTVRVLDSDSIGVVTCVVELLDAPAPDDRFFQNVKVFRRSGGEEWRLVYWQVSGKPAP